MPNTNETKEKVWCSSFTNCFARGTPSPTTWRASALTDVVLRGFGCKILDGEADESCSSSSIEKGEDIVYTLQPKTSSEHILIPVVTEDPGKSGKCAQKTEELTLTCLSSSSSSSVDKIIPQVPYQNIVQEENGNLLKNVTKTQEKEEDELKVGLLESLEEAITECSGIDTLSPPPLYENVCEPSADLITTFINQESKGCDSFHQPVTLLKRFENQDQLCEGPLNVLETNEQLELSTNIKRFVEVLQLDPQVEVSSADALTQPVSSSNSYPSIKEQLILISQDQQLDQPVNSHFENLSQQGKEDEIASKDSLIKKPENVCPQVKNPISQIPKNSVPFKEQVQDRVAIQSRFVTEEVTAGPTETIILIEGDSFDSLVSQKEEKLLRSEKPGPSLTENQLVSPSSSSAAVSAPSAKSPPVMESLSAGTEMLSISSLEDNLSSREVSPASDDLLETLAYVPDLDDTDDIDLEMEENDEADEKPKVFENSDNGESEPLESGNSLKILDNTSAVPSSDNATTNTSTTASNNNNNNNPLLITPKIGNTDSSVETTTNNNNATTQTTNSNTTTTTTTNSNTTTTTTTNSNTTTTTTTTTSSTNKKKNKKNANNNNTMTSVETPKVDNKNNNANLSVKNEMKKGENKDQTSKSQKANSKNKKKDDKSNDHILRALSSLSTPEEKLAALCKKYTELHEENRELGANSKQNQRKLAVLTRQKEQLQLENNKAVMAKSQLESLCRELQKHNRLIKEESLARAKEEDEKRKEISAKFQSTINEIQAQMVDNHDRNLKLREENTELATKLKTFLEQYEQREKYFEKIVKHRELEQQLADAKLKQASMQLVDEKEKNKKERDFMLMKASETDCKMGLLEKQVKTYKAQYSDFQTTITKSNDMFAKLRGEMDKMTVKIKKLEKDSAAWKSKWENCNKALLGMIDQKTTMDKERNLLLTKIQKLESLCRAQQERLRAQKSPPPSAECHKCCLTESSSVPSSNDTSAHSGNVSDTNLSSKANETTDPGAPAESCVTPDSVTPATSSTVQVPDSLPDLQTTENPSDVVVECPGASGSPKLETTDAVVADQTTSVQSCCSKDNVGDSDNSNSSSTNQENVSSDKKVSLVDHSAPVKSCTETT